MAFQEHENEFFIRPIENVEFFSKLEWSKMI